MTPTYSQLAEDLQSRLDIIADSELREQNPSEQLNQLQQVSERISAWHEEFKRVIPAQLNHFLQQQSLSKALDYIKNEGLDSSNPAAPE